MKGWVLYWMGGADFSCGERVTHLTWVPIYGPAPSLDLEAGDIDEPGYCWVL